MGRAVGPRVAARFGRTMLELGGNNAVIVTPSADLELALRGDRLLGRGHRRPTLHHAAPADRARSVDEALDAELTRLRRRPRRRSARARHAGRPADRRAAFDAMQRRARRGRALGGEVHWRRTRVDASARRLLCAPGVRRDARPDRPRAARNVRADPLRDALPTISTRRSTCTTPSARASRLDLHARLREAERSSRPRAPTAASPTSTSARRAPRSAARSAARRRPAAAARPAPTPGRPTCAARPTRSTTARPAAGAGRQLRHRRVK